MRCCVYLRGGGEVDLTESLDLMRIDWDRRAVHDALYWVYTVHGRKFENVDAYYRDGARHACEMAAPALKDWGRAPQGKTLLEIGCGIGRLFPGFERMGFSRIIGVDISPEMVSRGREWCPSRNAEFLLVDGERLSGVETSSIDFCFSYNVFQHMPEQRIFWSNLREMERVLRPGGYFQVQFRGSYSFKQLAARMLPASVAPKVRFMYRAALLRHPLRPPVSDDDDPGRSRTWELGVAVSPTRVIPGLEAMGFTDVKVTRDTGYSDGRRFWVTGRKPGP